MESGATNTKGDNKSPQRNYIQRCPFLIEAWSRPRRPMDKGRYAMRAACCVLREATVSCAFDVDGCDGG